MITRRCSACEVEKPLEAFHVSAKRKHGRTYACRDCTSAARRAAWQAIKANPKLHAKLREQNRARAAERYKHPQRKEWMHRYTHSRRGFTARLKNQFKISFEEWSAQLIAQSGRCGGCGDHLTASACTDHCHATGKFRGILCSGCNKAIEMCGDSPATLRALADYLEAAAR